MTCDRVRAQLTGYLDGELDDDRGTVVRGHLRTCAACRQVAADEAALRDGLRALPTLDPPPSLWAGVQARLAAEEVAEASRPAWRRTLARWGRFVPSAPRLAAGALVGAAAVTVVWWKTQREPATEVVASEAPGAHVEPAGPVVIDQGRHRFEASAEEGDVTDDLRAEPARIVASYRRTIDELREVAAGMRSEWSDGQRAAFDAKLAALEAALAAAPEGKPRRRASYAVIDYLQGVVIREDVLLASTGGPR